MAILSPSDSQRMAALVNRQAQRLLTDEEWAELEKLVATYGRLLHEHRVREVARKQGRPLKQMRGEMEHSVIQAAEQWRAMEDDLAQNVGVGNQDTAQPAR